MEKEVVIGRKLNFAYAGRIVLQDVDLQVEERDYRIIVGPNGGGKTTLLKLILGFLTPQSGSLNVLGASPAEARRSIGYVPQESMALRNFPLRVPEVILMSRLHPWSLGPYYSRQDREITEHYMEQLGLQDSRRKLFSELSGGQRQRVLIARALVSEPKLLLLDEPTASVDAAREEDIYDLLHKLNERLTIIMVTHDFGVVGRHVKTVTCLNRTAVTHPVAEVRSDLLQGLYAQGTSILNHHCGI